MTKIEREDDGKKGRFVLRENDQLAGELIFSWVDQTTFSVDHTEVGQAFGGKGYGKQLVMKAVEFARERGTKILPVCPYAKAVFQKDQHLQDVISPN